MKIIEPHDCLLMRGNSGENVGKLKKALRQAMGAKAKLYKGLAKGDDFDADTETALRIWQSEIGLEPDGIAGPRNLTVLGLFASQPLSVELTTHTVSELFPHTRKSNIERNLPYVVAALQAFMLTDPTMIGVALGTIRAETEGFAPIAEHPSHFNTLPGQEPFSAYQNKRGLGNTYPGDGPRYRGRGFVQLTGRANYEKYGELLQIPLVNNPDSGCAPEVAACLLAAFLSTNKEKIYASVAKNNLKSVRKVVNGGSHGFERFVDTFKHFEEVSSLPRVQAMAATEEELQVSEQRAALTVQSDPADLRDRSYTPPPYSLPELFPGNEQIKAYIGAYSRAGLILNQGREGACTGFGLACVINYLRWIRAKMPTTFESVSPRMLYTFARRYDEYEGENYSGSSCRGALKGWFHNGVCSESYWRYVSGQNSLPNSGWDIDAIERTLGVYYRIQVKAITDLQAAIHEVGAIFVSAYTHKGWETVKNSNSIPGSHAALPLIDYNGQPSRKGGHAFALVGFNRTGFVIQNSWGTRWGSGGFAVISYEDWLAHGMDAWVAALGVPGVVSGRLASDKSAESAKADAATSENWWNENMAYQHSIILGNNGRVNRFHKLDTLSRTLQNQACILPDAWFRTNQETKKRLVIYAHGGLNSEDDALKRVRAMGRYFLGNGCYPLFLLWKSGLFESIGNILSDTFKSSQEKRVRGFGDWLSDTISDPIIEKTIGRPLARPLWSEMKENAELASENGRGGDLLISAMKSLADSWGDSFELHLIGHSAGSIILGRMLDNLSRKALADTVKSVHLYAPACSVAFANRYYAPQKKIMERLYLDILSDNIERDDSVTIYKKSLLYLVSNALEADARTPILGMENVFLPEYSGWDGSSSTAETLSNWRNVVEVAKLKSRVSIHNMETITTRIAEAKGASTKKEKATHGGFDNDVDVINTTLQRITGKKKLNLPVDDLVGF